MVTSQKTSSSDKGPRGLTEFTIVNFHLEIKESSAAAERGSFALLYFSQ
jgi:hypothetical protein